MVAEERNKLDLELEDAFRDGNLQAGTYKIEEEPKTYINDKNGLKTASLISNIKLSFPEILLSTSKNVPIHMEQDQIDVKQIQNTPQIPKIDIMELNKKENHLAKNDFQRETYFYNLAQSSIYQILPNVKESGIKIERPDDYFAEMLKSDGHMDKIKRVLLDKQTRLEKVEKIVQSRRERKFHKKLVKVEQAQQKASKASELKKAKLWKKKNAESLGKKIINNDTTGIKDTRYQPQQKKLSKKALYKLQKFGKTGFNTALTNKIQDKPLRKGFQKANNMKADDLARFRDDATKSSYKRHANNNHSANFSNKGKSRANTPLKRKKQIGKKRPGKNRRVKLKSIANNKN